MSNFVLLSLGSNLGDRVENISKAINELKIFCRIIKCSSLYKSAAFLPENSPQEWNKFFYNCVLSAETNLNPHELLHKTQEIEIKLNTTPRQKGNSSPRMLDVDIIAFNQEIIQTEELQIPHPRMCERNFVMYPLAEIYPDWKYYGAGQLKGKTTAEIKNSLPEVKIV